MTTEPGFHSNEIRHDLGHAAAITTICAFVVLGISLFAAAIVIIKHGAF